jgi:hypothetical protein
VLAAGDRVHADRLLDPGTGYPAAMSDLVPHFAEPQPLPDGSTWTAEFESFDPRTGAVYYWVTLSGGRSYFVKVGDDDDVDRLRAKVAFHAEAGEPNTDYRGSVMWQMERGITS